MSTTIMIRPDSTDGQDTYIDEANPGTNYSAQNYLEIEEPGGDTRESLLLFDLSSVPVGATILSAKLGIYTKTVSGNATIKVCSAISPWVWDTVTWNTAPYFGTDSVLLTLAENTYEEADVLQIVQDWINKDRENYGFHLKGNFCDTVAHELHSSRDAIETRRPYLEIIYNAGPVENYPALHAPSHISTGADPIDDAVAGGASGLMSGADKTKLDGMAPGGEGHVFFELDNYVVKTATTWGLQKDTSAMYSCAVWSNCGLNNYVTFNVILTKGTYQFNVIYIKTADSGKVRYYLDPATDAIGTDTNKILEQDQYAAAAAWGNKTKVSSISITNPGLYRLKLKVYDKTGSSYAIYTESLSLTRTA